MLTWLFLPIVVVRLVITYHLEYILPRSNFVCFMIAMVFEVGLTWEHVRRVAILEDGSTKHEPSGMVRSWFRPNLRNEMRIVCCLSSDPSKHSGRLHGLFSLEACIPSELPMSPADKALYLSRMGSSFPVRIVLLLLVGPCPVYLEL
jgi:hypothetical protein